MMSDTYYTYPGMETLPQYPARMHNAYPPKFAEPRPIDQSPLIDRCTHCERDIVAIHRVDKYMWRHKRSELTHCGEMPTSYGAHPKTVPCTWECRMYEEHFKS